MLTEPLELSLAMPNYDRTYALRNGKVHVEGVRLNYVVQNHTQIKEELIKGKVFDIAEFSLTAYILMLSQGMDDYVAIPVFPTRMFFHSAFYVDSISLINEPSDLKGKRIGITNRYESDAIWGKYILEQEYGISHQDVHWHVVGNPHDEINRLLPDEMKEQDGLTFRNEDKRGLIHSLTNLQVDAVIGKDLHFEALHEKTSLKKLIPDSMNKEIEFYNKEKLFPITHTIIIRKNLLLQYPWLAQSLYIAFCEAKNYADQWNKEPAVLVNTSPWSIYDLENCRQLLKDDYWPYGLEKNQKVMEFTLELMRQQGLLQKKISLQQLFPYKIKDLNVSVHYAEI